MVNKLRGGLKVAAVKAPVLEIVKVVEDLAILTGGQVRRRAGTVWNGNINDLVLQESKN